MTQALKIFRTTSFNLRMTHIFVFGSNRLGIHGAGAASFARKNHGAISGQGEGLQGNSYAIPTKLSPNRTLSLDRIREHVDTFIQFAHNHTELTFQVTRIGCGLAGYSDNDIAPMFRNAPANCILPPQWHSLAR